MAPSNRILVLVNKHLPGITIYDAETFQKLSQTKTMIAPHEVALSHDARYAYVPIYGSSGVGKPGTDEHTFHVFDTSDCSQVCTLDTGNFRRPHGLVVGRSGIVYVTAECAAAVIMIDPQRETIIGLIPTGSYTTHMIAINQEETRAYCSNVQSKTVSVLDLQTRQLIDTVATEGENQRITISPDGRWFVSSLRNEKKVVFYRTSDNRLDFEVRIEGAPFTCRFSGDGAHLFNVGIKDSQTCAWKIDLKTREVSDTCLIVGHDPGSIAVDQSTGLVFVSDQPSNQISILDAESWKIVRTIPTDASPDAMVFGTVR